jgi:hypothetical protein
MSTTPPEEPQASPPPPPPPPPAHTGGGYAGLGRSPASGAILPVPGNAERAVWVLVEILLAIVWAASDGFDAHGWAWATTWLTAAYIVSRGIAKASRVLEQ